MSVDRIAAEKLKWYLGAIPLAEILRPGDEAPGDGDVEDLVGVLGEGVLLPDPAPAKTIIGPSICSAAISCSVFSCVIP